MPRPWKPRIYLLPSLPDSPQVKFISQKVGLDPAAVVEGLKAFWLEAQVRAAEGGRIERKSAAWVDMIAGVSGLAAAMVEAEWLRVTGGGLVVPGFDTWISKAAVKRIEAARWMAAKRSGGKGHNDQREPTFANVRQPGPTSAEQPAQPTLPGIEPKKERKPRGVKVADPNFWRFWKAYPKQWNQPAAAEAWAELAPDAGLVETMLAAIEAWKLSPQWTKRAPDGSDFIPAPANWLSGRRWQDQLQPAGAGGPLQPGGRVRSGQGEYGRKRKFGEAEAGGVPQRPQPGLFDPQAEEPGEGA
jgi:hypothetical protein